LAFKWLWEKVRHGGRLPEFEAQYVCGEWQIRDDERLEKVAEMLRANKTQTAIARELGLDQSTVSRFIRKATAKGLLEFNAKYNAKVGHA
jgi:IS30 family transposase